ncbi:MAG: hypothetical protein JSV80_07915, partial [Acidobacteriota bacterium]
QDLSLVPVPFASDLPPDSRLVPKKLTEAERRAVERAPLGSRDNPVRCFTPAGELGYLRRLRCASGAPPSYERVGYDGIGPYGTALDAFRVACAGRCTGWVVFFDMAHEGYVEKRPVPGFSIVPPRSS